jgi:putative addiction module component (TIGR02574 family)
MTTNLCIPPGFDAASSEERIAFVQELWDRIAANPERVSVPTEHQRILEERLAEYRADPHSGREWSAVRDELLAKIRRT